MPSLRANGSREARPDERNSARSEMTGSAKQSSFAVHWIASAYAQARFGGLQARHSSHSEQRRVAALAPRNDDKYHLWMRLLEKKPGRNLGRAFMDTPIDRISLQT